MGEQEGFLGESLGKVFGRRVRPYGRARPQPTNFLGGETNQEIRGNLGKALAKRIRPYGRPSPQPANMLGKVGDAARRRLGQIRASRLRAVRYPTQRPQPAAGWGNRSLERFRQP